MNVSSSLKGRADFPSWRASLSQGDKSTGHDNPPRSLCMGEDEGCGQSPLLRKMTAVFPLPQERRAMAKPCPFYKGDPLTILY